MSYSSGATYFDVFRILSSSASIFPNATQTLARFDPHSLTIHLSHVTRDQFRALVSVKHPSSLARPFAIIVHEFTHWLDLISTVWGQEYLLTLYAAYVAVLEPGDEPEAQWWRTVSLYDQDRRIMFPTYYRVHAKERWGHSLQKPWTIDFSCGQEFASDGRIDPANPIFFVSFGHNPTRERISRQPISVGTLLETNATYAEQFEESFLVSCISVEEERRIEQTIRSNQFAQQLYSAELTEYSSPVHLLAVKADIKEATEAYEAASSLSMICLNLINNDFANLKVPEAFKPFGQDRIGAFRGARNRGFAYACIAFNAPRIREHKSIEEWLEVALKSSGLPSKESILSAAAVRLEKIRQELTPNSRYFRSFNYIMDVGRQFAKRRATEPFAGQVHSLMMSDLPLPTVFDREGNIFPIGKNSLDSSLFNPEHMFDLDAKLHTFTQNFLTGCRGI